MGFIHIILKLFWTFLKKDKAMFLLISLGITICSLILFVFTGYYFIDRDKESQESLLKNRVTMRFENFENFDAITEQLLTYPFVENIIYSMETKGDGNIKIECYYHEYNISKNNIASGKLITNSNTLDFNSSRSFTQRYLELYGGVFVLGTEIIINGCVLKCEGILFTDDFDILIPYNILLEMKPKIVDITYIYKSGTSIFTIEDMNARINDEYEPLYVIRSQPSLEYNFTDFLSNASNIVILLCISILNYMFIYCFIIKKRLYSYSILKLCGMSEGKLFIAIFIEMGIIFLFSYLVAYIIYFIALFLQNLYVISLSVAGYQLVYSFIILWAINLITFFIMTRGTFKMNPHKLYVESVVE